MHHRTSGLSGNWWVPHREASYQVRCRDAAHYERSRVKGMTT